MLDVAASSDFAWIDVYDDDSLWDGEKVGVDAGGAKILLMRVGGTVVAYRDACPHKGTPLSDGELEDGVLVCGVHLWEFDATSGRSINPKGQALSCFPVRVENGRIFVALRSA